MAKSTAKPASKSSSKASKGAAKAPKAKAAAGAETNLVRRVTARARSENIEHFRAGDTVNVYVKVKEGEKERTQVYKGVCTKVQGSGSSRAFTVRKISAGVGVERTFPFTSPALDRVELVTKGMVRRARLFYLRGLEGKAAKIESEIVARPEAESKNNAKAETPAAE